MGEIADGMINGDFDFYTGEYIGKGKGFPRTIDKSLAWEKGNHKHSYNGVMKFLIKRGINKAEERNTLVFRYCMEHQLKINTITVGCVSISNDFPKFAKWFNNQK